MRHVCQDTPYEPSFSMPYIVIWIETEQRGSRILEILFFLAYSSWLTHHSHAEVTPHTRSSGLRFSVRDQRKPVNATRQGWLHHILQIAVIKLIQYVTWPSLIYDANLDCFLPEYCTPPRNQNYCKSYDLVVVQYGS